MSHDTLLPLLFLVLLPPSVSNVRNTRNLQAPDKEESQVLQGGEDVTVFLVPIEPSSPEEDRSEGYIGNVRDEGDGTYIVSFLPEIAG